MGSFIKRVGRKALDLVRNSKKPIVGAIAGGLGYLATRAGFDLSPDLSALISGGVFTAAVRIAKPIFGVAVKSPVAKPDAHGNLKISHPR